MAKRLDMRNVNKLGLDASSSELEDEIDSEEEDPNRELKIEDILNP